MNNNEDIEDDDDGLGSDNASDYFPEIENFEEQSISMIVPSASKEKGELENQSLDTTDKSKGKSQFIFKKSFNAFELFNLETINIPKLVNPFLQKTGLASLVGTSDTGKSTFLRQLALSVVLKRKDFLGFLIDCEHHRAIYVTTEDDYNSVSFSLRKQIKELQKQDSEISLSDLKNLDFIFDSEDLLKTLNSKLDKNNVDLIIIDAFTDIFSKELNANTQVRTFLNSYSSLANKHNCLILFLHHIGKRTQNTKTPSKDNIIGSQGFEAKMRVVLELRPNIHKPNLIDLWVLKSNFLESKHKNNSYVLSLDENMFFTNTGLRNSKYSESKSNNPDLIKKVLELYKEGLSTRKIETELKGSEFEIGKSTVNSIIKNNSN
jgi:hypothetical protein